MYRYKDISKEIQELNVSLKTRFLAFLTALVISLIVVAGPICLCINLMIFEDIQKLLSLGIGFLLVVFFVLGDYIYLKIITKSKVSGIGVILMTDGAVFTIFICIFLLLLFFRGVI